MPVTMVAFAWIYAQKIGICRLARLFAFEKLELPLNWPI
jgi:hypothetical protein